MNFEIFATVHNHINDTNLIDSRAAKVTCLCNTLGTSNSIARSDTGVVIDSEPHLSPTYKTSLFAPVSAHVPAGCSAYLFFTLQQNRLYDYGLNTKLFCFLNYKYMIVLIPDLCILPYFAQGRNPVPHVRFKPSTHYLDSSILPLGTALPYGVVITSKVSDYCSGLGQIYLTNLDANSFFILNRGCPYKSQ